MYYLVEGQQTLDGFLAHYMASPKCQNELVLSACFIIGLKCQEKSQKFPISCPTTHFCLSCELPGIEAGSTAKLPITLTNKPNTQVKECYLYMYMKSFRSAKW